MHIRKTLRRLFTFTVFSIAVAAHAQVITLSGVVLDVNTHREIRSVNILIKGTKLGTNSDLNGRYSLQLPSLDRSYIVSFRHVGYEPREIALDSLLQMKQIYLQPRVIQLPDVEVEAEGVKRFEIAKDLPQAVSVIEAKDFEIRGYVDAGDLLKTDHSVQVEEQLSGKKTVSIRGGNPDEVVVVYNGVKMNNAFDNTSDLSVIDLEDIESFQIIKGSNTALYGPEAFSGVINIVPRLEQNYNVRFQQRLGTYRSGNWGLHMHQKLEGLNLSYSFKQGGTQRNFVDDAEGMKGLENTSQHHTANLVYNLSPNSDAKATRSLGLMFLNTSLKYDNRRDDETQSNLDQLLSVKYAGGLSVLKRVELSLSARRQREELALANIFSRDIDDRGIHANAEKRMQFGRLEWLFGYQFQHDDLHFRGDDSPAMQRRHHGFISIAKLHGAAGTGALNAVDLDVSVRHDRLHDEQLKPILPVVVNNPDVGAITPNLFRENNWNETTFKMALTLSGSKKDLTFNTSMSFGSNVKFPTLFQQISAPDVFTSEKFTPSLNPEKNNSLEVTANVSRDVRGKSAIYGWAISGSYFRNDYTNKFREFSIPGLAFALYDNSPDARLSGLEATTSVFLFRKKLTVSSGLSRYFISEKVAFAFKADLKRTLNVLFDHAGFSFQLYWFKEGEQAGIVRQQKREDGELRFTEVILPAYSNLDLHLSKSFTIGRLKLFGNASARNLLNAEEVVLDGIAIRDRRYYLTFGAQY